MRRRVASTPSTDYIAKEDNIFWIYAGEKRYKKLMIVPWVWVRPDLAILKSLNNKQNAS